MTRVATLAMGSEIPDDGLGELGALHFLRALHLAGEVIRDDLLRDRLLHGVAEGLPRLLPSEVLEHHHAREDLRGRVRLVHPRVLRRGPVDRLEHRMAFPDVPAGSDTEPA